MKAKLLIIILIIFVLTGCTFYKEKNISKKLEINSNKCVVKEEIDTHDGFLGDGDYFAIIICEDLKIDQLSNNWKELPLSEALEEFFKIEQCDTDECKNFFEKYKVPEDMNGYYYFFDRNSKAIDKHDDSKLHDRVSYNFNIALYDVDNNLIYYYEIDT